MTPTVEILANTVSPLSFQQALMMCFVTKATPSIYCKPQNSIQRATNYNFKASF